MEASVVADHLSKQFGLFRAADGVTFFAHGGEIFGLLGPNGAGKTTTIRLIATILQPTDGTASVCGTDIREHPEEARKHIGVLTTEIGVYERFSGRENLRYFGMLYGLNGETLERRINELVALLDMADFIDRRAGKYSTGMKQKLAIARSVIHNPDVIIFDEPTAGLDVLASQTVIRFMKNSREQRKLVILSTHEMTDAEKLCDRVAIMHNGKILTTDTVEGVKQKTGGRDLEEAFVSLVHGGNTVQPREQLQKMDAKKSFFFLSRPILLRMITVVLVVIGIVGDMLHWFQNSVGYALIILGALFALGARRLKRTSPQP
ncbi:MAG: ATP-binding cassette domain-containing protein [bacterium]